MTASGVQLAHTPEDATPCGIANRVLHYNAAASEVQLRNLLATLFDLRREHQQFKEKELQAFITETLDEGCLASSKPPTPPCRVSTCPF